MWSISWFPPPHPGGCLKKRCCLCRRSATCCARPPPVHRLSSLPPARSPNKLQEASEWQIRRVVVADLLANVVCTYPKHSRLLSSPREIPPSRFILKTGFVLSDFGVALRLRSSTRLSWKQCSFILLIFTLFYGLSCRMNYRVNVLN